METLLFSSERQEARRMATDIQAQNARRRRHFATLAGGGAAGILEAYEGRVGNLLWYFTHAVKGGFSDLTARPSKCAPLFASGGKSKQKKIFLSFEKLFSERKQISFRFLSFPSLQNFLFPLLQK